MVDLGVPDVGAAMVDGTGEEDEQDNEQEEEDQEEDQEIE